MLSPRGCSCRELCYWMNHRLLIYENNCKFIEALKFVFIQWIVISFVSLFLFSCFSQFVKLFSFSQKMQLTLTCKSVFMFLCSYVQCWMPLLCFGRCWGLRANSNTVSSHFDLLLYFVCYHLSIYKGGFRLGNDEASRYWWHHIWF